MRLCWMWHWLRGERAGLSVRRGRPGRRGLRGRREIRELRGRLGRRGRRGRRGSTVAGASVLNYQGAYAAGVVYALHDVVSFGGSSYVSLTGGNQANTPGVASQW